MLTLLIFVLAIYGISNGATVLKARYVTKAVLGWIPVARGIAHCPACFAFWAGAACSLFALSPSLPVTGDRWISAVVDGLVGSGTTWLFHTTQARLTHGVPEPKPEDKCEKNP